MFHFDISRHFHMISCSHLFQFHLNHLLVFMFVITMIVFMTMEETLEIVYEANMLQTLLFNFLNYLIFILIEKNCIFCINMQLNRNPNRFSSISIYCHAIRNFSFIYCFFSHSIKESEKIRNMRLSKCI